MFQKIFNMFFLSLVVLCCASLIIGCSSTSSKNAPLTAAEQNSNLNERIANADLDMTRAYSDQWDVLAFKEMKRSAERLDSVKKLNAKGRDFEKVAKELRGFDEAFRNAKAVAESRAPRVEGLLAVRRKALDADIRQNSALSPTLNRLDQKFRDLADDNRINVNEFSQLQNEYQKLSGDVAKGRNLTFAKQQIEFAIKNKARRYAPRSLNRAELDLRSAESVIETNLQNPEAQETAVKKANFSALMLSAVVEEQRRANYNLDEMAAQKIVQQTQNMNKLNEELRKRDEELYYSKSELKDYQSELENSRTEMSQQEEELQKAEREKRFQIALQSAQKQFSKSEADVYRQGDKILIRLKKIEFPSGQTKIPSKAEDLLGKVAEVAKELGPQQIVVEGHTDSIGSAEINNKISQERADAVKDFLANSGIEQSILQSEGHGFENPLTSNKTKAGRAQNRRVDVWIVPEPLTTATE